MGHYCNFCQMWHTSASCYHPANQANKQRADTGSSSTANGVEVTRESIEQAIKIIKQGPTLPSEIKVMKNKYLPDGMVVISEDIAKTLGILQDPEVKDGHTM